MTECFSRTADVALIKLEMRSLWVEGWLCCCCVYSKVGVLIAVNVQIRTNNSVANMH